MEKDEVGKIAMDQITKGLVGQGKHLHFILNVIGTIHWRVWSRTGT